MMTNSGFAICCYCRRYYPLNQIHTCGNILGWNDRHKEKIALVEAEQIKDEEKILKLEERVRNLENLTRERVLLNSIKDSNKDKSSSWLFWTLFAALLIINISVLCLVLL